MRDTVGFEASEQCPVSLDFLGQLYRSDAAEADELLQTLPGDRRARLALFCYHRAHLRDLALRIAETCEPERLAQLAGVQGQVLATQCRTALSSSSFGREALHRSHLAKVSLAGSRVGASGARAHTRH
jgi:hypothetical protein